MAGTYLDNFFYLAYILKQFKALSTLPKWRNLVSAYTNEEQEIYYPGHNILDFDIQYGKLGFRIAWQVTKRLKAWDLRKLGNIRKLSILGWHIA